MGTDYVRLLEVQPSLGTGLTGEELADARRLAVAPVVTLPAGHWKTGQLRRTLGLCTLGYIIVDGLIAHDLALDGRVATYLLGPGDLVAPAVPPSRGLPVIQVFGVADATRLASLDVALPAVAQRWPSIAGALLVLAERQMERVAMQQFISQLPRADERIVALFWHLAERWSRVEHEGVVVPLVVSHEAIARLVGGRRPTVSAALGRLADRKLVVRMSNGTWLLAPASRALLDDGPAAGATPRVRALGRPRVGRATALQ